MDVHGNVSAPALVTPPVIVGVPGGDLPAAVSLGPPTPNPMRADTRFTLALPAAGGVTFTVFDPRGRVVRRTTLPRLEPGVHTLHWDGRDAGGSETPSGIYFYRVEVGGASFRGRIARVG